MPNQPGDGTQKNDRQLLKEWIAEWMQLDASIKDYAGGGETDELQSWKEQRRSFADKIVDLVSTKPKFYELAVEWGFNAEILADRVPDESKPDSGGGGTENSSGNSNDGNSGGDGTNGNDNSSGGGNNNGGGGGGAPNNGDSDSGTFLGRLGKDYKIIKNAKGDYALVYSIVINGKKTKIAYDVTAAQLKDAGLSEKNATLITKEQWNNLEYFGNVKDIPIFDYKDKRNPFDKTIEYIEALYGGQGILKNKEVRRILAMGYIEGLPEQQILGLIRQTDWYKSRSDEQRSWLAVPEGEKADRIGAMKTQLTAALQSLWGDKWRDQYDEAQLDRWARRIASGTWQGAASPDAAFNAWQLQETFKAQGVMGTPAQVDKDSQDQDIINSDTNPDNVFGRLRDEAISYFGYGYKPDQETIRGWATQIAGGDKSDQDWLDYMKKVRASQMPWLNPDVGFQDFASPYKNAAENILGTSLDWKDKLFSSLGYVSKDGKAENRAMTQYEFEEFVRRNDPRFKKAPGAIEQAAGFVNSLNSIFNGVPS